MSYIEHHRSFIDVRERERERERERKRERPHVSERHHIRERERRRMPAITAAPTTVTVIQQAGPRMCIVVILHGHTCELHL